MRPFRSSGERFSVSLTDADLSVDIQSQATFADVELMVAVAHPVVAPVDLASHTPGQFRRCLGVLVRTLGLQRISQLFPSYEPGAGHSG